MGKIDDMRRQREARLGGATDDGGAEAGDGADATTGRCVGCGKVKAVQQGLVVGHQKGLGSMCPGSRKPPA